MHIHPIEDADGEIIDAVNLCSDSCHRDYCEAAGVDYPGWSGAHEPDPDVLLYCDQCGVRLTAAPVQDCDWDCVPIDVNRLPTDEPIDHCEHGVPGQVPVRLLRT